MLVQRDVASQAQQFLVLPQTARHRRRLCADQLIFRIELTRDALGKFDPEPDVNRKGVNIVIHSRPGEPDIGERKIKRLMQRNVSLGEALKHVCTATGVSYKVDGNIVVIYDAPKN